MSSPKSVSFNRRLSELNQWQIEQDTKLKNFQESKKKLLSFEFDSIWKSLGGSKDKLIDLQKDDSSNKENQAPALKGPSFAGSRERLDDGCASGRYAKDLEKKTEEEEEEKNNGLRNDGGQWSESVVGSKTFLRRGDGLKRFRMTLEDFKAPPKIYRDQHIKVLKNKKTEPSKKIKKQTLLADRVEHAAKCRRNTDINVGKMADKKRTGIAVNIYVKGDKCREKSALENSSKEGTIKAGFSNNLKDFSCVKSNFSVCKELDKEVVPYSRGKICRKTVLTSPIDACLNSDIENRRDENELKIFEILEEKVNESSFCSSSSLIDKLLNPHRGGNAAVGSSSTLETAIHESEMSESTCFVPVPFSSADLEAAPTATESLSAVNRVPSDQFETGAHGADSAETRAREETVDKLELRTAKVVQPSPKTLASRKKIVERRLSDQRFESPRNDTRVSVPPVKSGGEVAVKSELVPDFDQKEMAAKLRRKGLQDNVKLLMNWDGPPRKKCVKKNVVRKSKPKFKKPEKPKASCREESEKVVFNSTLLKERLNELEREILIFRKENSALERMKRECQEERIRLTKEKKEFEKRMEVEKNSLVTALAEDRRKLQKERLVFETYCKEARSRPSREERQQISRLKGDLEKMAETLATKEARWGASQARLRNQIRTLESENERLRAENEKLKNAGPKRVSFGSGKALNAKIIRVVNTELDKLNPRTGTGLVRGCDCGVSQAPGSMSCPEQEKKKPLRRIMSAPNMKESKASGSRSATPDPETPTFSGYSRAADQSLPGDSDAYACDESESECLVDQADKSPDRGTGQNVDVVDAAVLDELIEKLGSRDPRSSYLSSVPKSCLKGTENSENSPPETAAAVDKNLSTESLYRHPFPRREESRTREKRLEDGTREIIYPNGNVKRIFPDNKIVRILYYNGDVKEIDFEEGNEKYYYSETQTWHMSYRDGMDVVEFPTGQTERRYPDGSSEISFPNGCVRYCDASGRDEWRFPDGTVMKTNEKGHKVLIMANGQKEIRTNEFKQREYPDGTIKIVYSNGTQETRYASGRVRLKDGDGNLVMDTAGERL